MFDLDPGDGVAWSFVVETALNLRELLIRRTRALAQTDRR